MTDRGTDMIPCEQADRIMAIDERLHQGDLHFQSMKADLNTIKSNQANTQSIVTDMYKRMFIDNGKKSIQTMIDRHDSVIRVQIWIVSALGASVIGFIVWSVLGG